MNIFWSICAVISFTSMTLFFITCGRRGFFGIILSIILSISLQSSYTIKPDNFVSISTYGDSYLLYERQNNLTSIICKDYELTVNCENLGSNFILDKINKSISINGLSIDAKNFYFDSEINSYIIRTKTHNIYRWIIFVSIFSCLMLTSFFAGIFKKNSHLYEVLKISLIFWNSLRFSEKFLLILFPFIFSFSTTGVDISAFNKIISLNSRGIDIYFYQSLIRLGHWKAEFAPFPYPPFAASVFTPFFAFLAPIFGLLGDGFGTLDPKFTSPALMPMKLSIYYIYLSSAIIFAANFPIIGASSRKLFYCFLLYPVSMYISGFYGHIDGVTLFLFVIYLSLLRKQKTIAVGIIFIFLLLATKLQSILLLPVLITPLFFVWSQRLFNGFKLSWKNLLCVILSFIIICTLPFFNSNLSTTLFGYPQNARVWFTTLQYAPGVFFYFSIFFLMCALSAWVSIVEKSKSDEDIIYAIPFGIAITVLWFSASILFTHSFLSIVAPAFALVLASSNISVIRKMLITLLSFGALANLVFFDNGDVSRILIQSTFFSNKKTVEFISLMHTVAISSLFITGLLLYSSLLKIVGGLKDR